MVTALEPAPTRVAWGWRASADVLVKKEASLAAQGLTTVKLHLPIIHSPDETHAVLSKRIVEDLSKVGVTVELLEEDALGQAVQRGDFEGLALISRDTSAASRFMNVPSDSGSPPLTVPAGPHFDAEMVERYDRFDTSLYAERRGALEAALQRAWFARLPMIPLVLTSRLSAVRADLVGPEWGQADSLWWNVADWHLLN